VARSSPSYAPLENLRPSKILGNPPCAHHPNCGRAAAKPDEVRHFIQVTVQLTSENRLVVSDTISKQADVFKVIVNLAPELSDCFCGIEI
jgi:hypothetical protein